MVSISAAAFAAKAASKRELYRFVSHDCGMYLPSYETVTVFHMKDLMNGSRTKIQQTLVKHIAVPHFEGLKVEAMMDFAKNYPDALRTLPVL